MSKKCRDQENVSNLDKENIMLHNPETCWVKLIHKDDIFILQFSVDQIIDRAKYQSGSRDNKIMYQYLRCIFEEKPNKFKLYLMYPSSVPKEQYLSKCLTEGWLHILLE